MRYIWLDFCCTCEVRIQSARPNFSLIRYREHLYRRHRAPIQCRRCWKIFETAEDLFLHSNVADIDKCELQPELTAEGITPDVERRMRSRRKTHRSQSEEYKWKELYSMLFPRDEIPSPCKEQISRLPKNLLKTRRF
jgi:hypothetical protein